MAPSWPPVVTRLDLPSDKTFFFLRNKNLYLLFYPWLSLILCCCFLRFKFFFGIFVKCFWQFGYAKFHSWCDYKLAITKPRANRKRWINCQLIKWLIFSSWVIFYGSSLRQCFKQGMRCVPYCSPSRATACKSTLYIAKIQYKLRVVSGLNLSWYGSMKWNMEKIFSMEWKIFSMEWKSNGRKLPELITEKSSSIPYQHALAVVHYSRIIFGPGFLGRVRA